MSPEHDNALCTAYPLLFRKRGDKRRRTPISWGFECGDGWFHIIDALGWAICWRYSMAREQYERLRVKFELEEAEGGMDLTSESVERALVQLETQRKAVPAATQVKEKFGQLRVYLHGASAEQGHYVEMAEILSSRVCEGCGAPGKLRRGGWLRTLCDNHQVELTANEGNKLL